MNFRTDLAVERSESMADSLPKGVSCTVEEGENRKITRIRVMDEEGAAAIGKPCGTYITVEVPPFGKNAPTDEGVVEDLAACLRELLPPEGVILVAGLGNDDITPDALGPKAGSMILATRHIEAEFSKSAGLPNLRPVVNLVPGVLGKTGMETGEILRGAVEMVHPAAVITMDALAARKLSRLGCTVQLSDTGVTPGSGVGNARAELSRQSLGVPVIAIGVPTVVDASTMVSDLTGEDVKDGQSEQMMVTPREIDLLIDRAARLLALSVNKALQPDLSVEDIWMLVS